MTNDMKIRLNLRNVISRRKYFNGSRCRWKWKPSFFNNWDCQKEFRSRSETTNGRYAINYQICRNIKIKLLVPIPLLTNNSFRYLFRNKKRRRHCIESVVCIVWNSVIDMCLSFTQTGIDQIYICNKFGMRNWILM